MKRRRAKKDPWPMIGALVTGASVVVGILLLVRSEPKKEPSIQIPLVMPPLPTWGAQGSPLPSFFPWGAGPSSTSGRLAPNPPINMGRLAPNPSAVT